MNIIKVTFQPWTNKTPIDFDTEKNNSLANLYGANLDGANLTGANLDGANLDGVLNGALIIARTSITPSHGSFIGYKMCRDNVVVKLEIPAEARRSNASGRKCRAEYVKVLELSKGTVGISEHDGVTQYRVGEIVRCDRWNKNRWKECSGGIHFFITQIEAENYN